MSLATLAAPSIASPRPSTPKLTNAPNAPVLIALPAAVERSEPCSKSLVALARKPATAPPSGPADIAAAVVNTATAILALPGFSFAQSLTA